MNCVLVKLYIYLSFLICFFCSLVTFFCISSMLSFFLTNKDEYITSDVSELSVYRMNSDFLHAIEAFNRLGSQWKVDYIIEFSTTLASFRPAQGSSYLPTPTRIAAKNVLSTLRTATTSCAFYTRSWPIFTASNKIRRACIIIDLICLNSILPV